MPSLLHMLKMRCKQVEAGEWVQPVRRGYLLQCCDCSLIHRMNFRVVKDRRGRSFIQFQAFRATNSDIRRHKVSVAITAMASMKPEEIVRLRLKLRLTQVQMAERLSVNTITISRWENGKRRPRPIYAKELVRLMND